jgi:hypothetical protein
MRASSTKLILAITILALSNSGIYFVTAYSQIQESTDASSMIETMLFATAAISYLPLGIWMVKNKLHSRAPYVIASMMSFALIGLYIISRTMSLPVVGIQEDVGVIDVTSKITQGSIIMLSVFLIRNWNNDKIKI